MPLLMSTQLAKRDAFEVFIDVCMLGLGVREHPPEVEPLAAVPSGTRATMMPQPPKKTRNPPGDKLKV